jgi:hypothetical protein
MVQSIMNQSVITLYGWGTWSLSSRKKHEFARFWKVNGEELRASVGHFVVSGL